MTREIGDVNAAQAASSFVEPVILVHFEFADDVRVHSGVGSITFDGDEYVGVGNLGAIDAAKETEVAKRGTVSFSLSGLDANMLREALDSATFYRPVTVYYGYRQADGTLYERPTILWRGRVDSSSFRIGPEAVIVLTAEHRIAQLDEVAGDRFTNEDQQDRFADDEFFEHIHDVPTKRLLWAGGASATGFDPRRNFRRDRGRGELP